MNEKKCFVSDTREREMLAVVSLLSVSKENETPNGRPSPKGRDVADFESFSFISAGMCALNV